MLLTWTFTRTRIVPTACTWVFRIIVWVSRDYLRQNNGCENCGVSVHVVPVFWIYASLCRYFSEYSFLIFHSYIYSEVKDKFWCLHPVVSVCQRSYLLPMRTKLLERSTFNYHLLHVSAHLFIYQVGNIITCLKRQDVERCLDQSSLRRP